MAKISVADVERIAQKVIGNANIKLDGGGSARDVPGWDSLAHTLIALELSDQLGVDVSAMQTARLPTFAALVDYLNALSKS